MDIIEEVLYLKELLSKEEIISKVHDCEKRMLEDMETQILINKYQDAITSFNDATRYHLDLAPYQKELSYTKEQLYKSKFVSDYLIALKEANKFLDEIKNELFSDILKLENSLNKNCVKK